MQNSVGLCFKSGNEIGRERTTSCHWYWFWLLE